MSKLSERINALGKDERLSVMTVFTTVKDDRRVVIESQIDNDFESELTHIAAKMKVLLKGSIPYAGYFKKVPVDEPIGFMDLHFFMDDVNPNEIRGGIYLEIQDNEFYETEWPEFVKDLLAEVIVDVNALNPFNLN